MIERVDNGGEREERKAITFFLFQILEDFSLETLVETFACKGMWGTVCVWENSDYYGVYWIALWTANALKSSRCPCWVCNGKSPCSAQMAALCRWPSSFLENCASFGVLRRQIVEKHLRRNKIMSWCQEWAHRLLLEHSKKSTGPETMYVLWTIIESSQKFTRLWL